MNITIGLTNKKIADDYAGFADSVQLIVKADFADFVQTNHQVTLIPTPGHT